MTEQGWIAERFEAHRTRLEQVAQRILGSRSEAADAVQETWLRFSRSDGDAVQNLGGWLTTVVARICLDMLRARQARREEPGTDPLAEAERQSPPVEPDHDALTADAVGVALMVVLERLAPAERVAFVLHDLFDLPFEEVARILDRSLVATRQLASRARRRVQGTGDSADPEKGADRQLVDAFLAASREGDLSRLLAILDPEVVLRTDAAAARMGGKAEVRGAAEVAALFKGRAQAAIPALLDGMLGILVAPHGRMLLVLRLTIVDGRIVELDAVADKESLARLSIRELPA